MTSRGSFNNTESPQTRTMVVDSIKKRFKTLQEKMEELNAESLMTLEQIQNHVIRAEVCKLFRDLDILQTEVGERGQRFSFEETDIDPDTFNNVSSVLTEVWDRLHAEIWEHLKAHDEQYDLAYETLRDSGRMIGPNF